MSALNRGARNGALVFDLSELSRATIGLIQTNRSRAIESSDRHLVGRQDRLDPPPTLPSRIRAQGGAVFIEEDSLPCRQEYGPRGGGSIRRGG